MFANFNVVDLLFVRAFFYNFRLFTNPEELVRLLIQRFHLQPPESLSEEELAIWTSRVLIPVRLRVYNVIKTWLESYFDYSRDAAVQKELLEFTERDMSQVMPSPAKRMANIIHKAVSSFLCLIKREDTDHQYSLLLKVSYLLNNNNHNSRLLLPAATTVPSFQISPYLMIITHTHHPSSASQPETHSNVRYCRLNPCYRQFIFRILTLSSSHGKSLSLKTPYFVRSDRTKL